MNTELPPTYVSRLEKWLLQIRPIRVILTVGDVIMSAVLSVVVAILYGVLLDASKPEMGIVSTIVFATILILDEIRDGNHRD